MRRLLNPLPLKRLPHQFADVIVLGSGVAGLRAALAAAEAGAEVLLVAKAALAETNTSYAQGGIAAVMAEEDSVASHTEDTLKAARGLAVPSVVERVTREAAPRLQELLDWGARFDREDGELALTREGGHSFARILHAGGDATGAEVQRVLQERAVAHESIRVMAETFAIDLLDAEVGGVAGLLVVGPDGKPLVLRAGAVVLAAGGLGALYRETTNPPIATGDGIAMAYRAGAVIRDLEFVQFHPTVLYIAGAARTLVSEAVRGEGAYLRDKQGTRFMVDVHPQAELAPRDVVSRAIVRRLAETGGSAVTLDCRHLDPARVAQRFPGIAAACSRFGLSLASDLIPVHPAAHYTIGGVQIDADGFSGVPGLYAAGEVASSGLHGANRLGSNSLLEALVYGARAGERAAAASRERAEPRLAWVERTDAIVPDDGLDLVDLHNSLAFLMWRNAGVERDGDTLAEGLSNLQIWQRYALGMTFEDKEGWELQNQMLLGRLILTAAAARRESRGAHYRRDFPETDEVACHSVQVRGGGDCRLIPREEPYAAQQESVERASGDVGGRDLG